MKKILLTLLLAFFSFIETEYALTNITINNNKLIPDFNINTKIYNVFVSSKIEIITINVESSEDEIITGNGSISLKKGLNIVEIISYKNNEQTDKYTLNIIRGEYKPDKKEALLSNLNINNHKIDFKSDTFSYKIKALEDEEKLNISYETTNPKATVKLSGDTNLSKKKNVIKITVTSEDKKTTNTYTLKVNKKIKKNTKETKESIFDKTEFSSYELKLIIIGIVLTGLIIIGIIFYLIFIKKRTNKVPNISQHTLHK